jgi:hypothetical protein
MMAEMGGPLDGDGKLKNALLALGKAQIDAMFAQQGDSRFTVDDAEFVPMLECVLTAFESHGLGSAEMETLWQHAYGIYDRLCREVEPDIPFEENRDLMRRYILGPRRLEVRRRKGQRRSPASPRDGE